jgi:DNA-binding MarR family transcriptional regulator
MTSPLQPDDYQALASFRYAMRKFLAFSKRALQTEVALTPEQYEALLALKAFSQSRGLTIGQLSEYLQVKPHSGVSLASKLVLQKLVSREAGDDRRHVFLRLSAKGDQVLAKAAAIHRQEMRLRSPEMIAALVRLQK